MTSEWAPTRDGRRLHLEREGSGEPTVVFESGMGTSRSMWGSVAPRVAAHATSVVYDRSGLGRSAPDDSPRNLARLVDDLVDVLDHLGPGPFVLVGHSWGGPVVRCAAAVIPDRIAGLVLVDQTDERCDLFFEDGNARQTRVAQLLLPSLARLGIVRLAIRRLASQLPEPAASAMRAEDGTPAAVRAQLAELAPCTEDLRRLRDHPVALPDVPVSVISGARSSRFERGRRGELLAAGRAGAESLAQGRHVLAHRSSHYVPFTDPDVVVDEILRIIAT